MFVLSQGSKLRVHYAVSITTSNLLSFGPTSQHFAHLLVKLCLMFVRATSGLLMPVVVNANTKETLLRYRWAACMHGLVV